MICFRRFDAAHVVPNPVNIVAEFSLFSLIFVTGCNFPYDFGILFPNHCPNIEHKLYIA